MKFASTRHPELVVHDLGVRFINGEAEITDRTTIEALRGLAADLGVRSVGGRPPKGSDDR